MNTINELKHLNSYQKLYLERNKGANVFNKSEIIDLINESIKRETKNENTTKVDYLKNLKSFISLLNVKSFIIVNGTSENLLNIGYLLENILLCYYYLQTNEGENYEIKALVINPVNTLRHQVKKIHLFSLQTKLIGLYEIANPMALLNKRMTSASAFVKVADTIQMKKESNLKDLINRINYIESLHL